MKKKVFISAICIIMAIALCYGLAQRTTPEKFVSIKLLGFEVSEISEDFAETWEIDDYQNKNVVFFNLNVKNYCLDTMVFQGGGIENYPANIPITECYDVWRFDNKNMTFWFVVENTLKNEEIEQIIKKMHFNVNRENTETQIPMYID